MDKRWEYSRECAAAIVGDTVTIEIDAMHPRPYAIHELLGSWCGKPAEEDSEDEDVELKKLRLIREQLDK